MWLRSRLRPPVDQHLDLGQASRDPIHLGLQTDDALELGRCGLHLSFQLADTRPQVRRTPRGHDGLADDCHDEGERHLLVEMPLPVFSLAHGLTHGIAMPSAESPTAPLTAMVKNCTAVSFSAVHAGAQAAISGPV